jgi:exosortase
MTNQAVYSQIAQYKRVSVQNAGWIGAGLLYFLLWLPEFKPLWADWSGDANSSQGPVIIILAVGLLWMQRDKIQRSNTACTPAVILLALTLFIYMSAVWADIAFVRLLSLISMPLWAIWYLCGWKSLQSTVGAIGMFVFMVPWPMTLTEHLTFPMQMISTTYSALLSGICGMPVHQEGVTLAVMPNPAARPLYSIMVASHCSGLASLTVLLTLGYLIAYFTPLELVWKVVIMATILPLTLSVNALRLTLILWAGAYHSVAAADWIHHHEAPVLILFCSLGLTGLRCALMKWAEQPLITEGDALVTIQTADIERASAAGSSR